MKVFEKLKSAMESHDEDAFMELMHDDFAFVRHQSGEKLDKAGMRELVKQMSSATDWKIESHRCLYENDDIMVDHSVMSFPDGTREAVLSANMLKDGKIVRMETGATPLK